MIDLKKIEKNIDEALAKETTESLTKWLIEKREKEAKIIADQANVIKSFYCQRDIEMESKCEKQCEHCKEYYAPLEELLNG